MEKLNLQRYGLGIKRPVSRMKMATTITSKKFGKQFPKLKSVAGVLLSRSAGSCQSDPTPSRQVAEEQINMKADILIESLAGNVGRDEVIRRLRHHHRDSNQVFYDLSAISDENHDEATNSVQDVMGSTSMASTSTYHGPTSDTAKHTPSAMTPLETLEEWRKTTISGHARPQRYTTSKMPSHHFNKCLAF
ncbi:uncharacterized protein [Ptychodera flava]|uniref:uncharacterized protein n=1 Tax=Ptychodera flava TaxID=63121 RepID=UPI00396A1634